MMLYDFVETALSYAEPDNIDFNKAGPAGNIMFDLRGWQYFCRHGENYLQHVGTSSGIRRVLEWKNAYDFDISIRPITIL